MRQEHFDLGRAHIARVALGMESRQTAEPDRRNTVNQPANTGVHLVKQHRFGYCTRGVIDRCFRVFYNILYD